MGRFSSCCPLVQPRKRAVMFRNGGWLVSPCRRQNAIPDWSDEPWPPTHASGEHEAVIMLAKMRMFAAVKREYADAPIALAEQIVPAGIYAQMLGFE